MSLDAAKAGGKKQRQPWRLPRKTSRSLLPCEFYRRHFLLSTSLCTSHHSQPNRYTRVARAASSGRRQFYHEKLLNSRLIACHSSQNKASERALCPTSSTAKAGSIATAHRLKHAWLASHHIARLSQQSKSSINSVAVPSTPGCDQSPNSSRSTLGGVAETERAPEQSAIRHRASGLGPVLEIGVCVGFFGAAC